MRKILAALFLFSLSAIAANIKLYLKDGNFHLVREYAVKLDRVHYYSVERSDWEEIPLELVDLKRTQTEETQRKAAIAEEAKILSVEDKVERELQEEVAKIPQNPGVYQLIANELKIFHLAESKVHTNKGRSVLKAMAPIPIVAGKATLEIEPAHSLNIVTSATPEFYIQLSQEERFGIFRLTPHLGVRIVEKLTIIPVTKEIVEEPEQVEIFRKQLADALFKIWPQKPLPAGEYAVVEYTEGKLNMQVWDFACKPEK
jgi:hypothetical protein